MATTSNQEVWYQIFAVGHPKLQSFQRLHKWLPSPPRCKMCFAPFRGVGGAYMRLRGKGPANRNPRFCSACDKFIRAFPGGAEVEMTMLFVDIRGSVKLGYQYKDKPTEYSRLMEQFYQTATKALHETDGFMIDLVGDEVVGVYPPGFSGQEHARKAIGAAEELLRTGGPVTSDGVQLPIGVGVHTGVVYIGTVGVGDGDLPGAQAGAADVRAQGDNANVTARLASVAQPGEALITEATCKAAGMNLDHLKYRKLELKGRPEPIGVRVMQATVH
jgi:adenylate cyclase